MSRQADDVMALLQDLVGFAPDEKWLPFSLAYLRTYGDANVLCELRRRLDVPKGTAWLWWKIRVNFVADQKIARRFAQLRTAMNQGVLPAAAAGADR